MNRVLALILAVFVGCFTSGFPNPAQLIIERLSTPKSYEAKSFPVEVPLEELSIHTDWEDSETVKVVRVYVNGKGPFKFALLLESGKINAEFVTGILLAPTMDKIGEKLRIGKIHHKIQNLRVGDITFADFLMEVYAPEKDAPESPILELDGALTSGIFKNLKVSFNDDYSRMILEQKQE